MCERLILIFVFSGKSFCDKNGMIKNASFKLTHNKKNFKKIKFFCSKAVMIDILKDDDFEYNNLFSKNIS